MKILWSCMIHEGDIDYLQGYINAFNSLNENNHLVEIRFFISGAFPKCKEFLEKTGFQDKYQQRLENDGFNKGFNCAVKYALDNNFDWLVTMTVRCTPEPDWLDKLQLEQFDKINPTDEKPVGMITTLTLSDKKKKKVFNLGHFISPSGGCLDFGIGLQKKKVENYAMDPENKESIWCPCSGAAAYRVKAFKNNGIFKGTNDVLNSALFKSYNCDAIGYFIKANGYRNKINVKSITVKNGIEESSSSNPKYLGFNMNQEISRVANILTYFKDCENVIYKYEEDMYRNRKNGKHRQFQINECKIEFDKSDFYVIRLLAKSFKRDFLKIEAIHGELIDHLNNFQKTKQWRENSL